MTDTTPEPPFRYESPAPELPAESCATHEVGCMVYVSAQVAEGVTAAHLEQYLLGHLGTQEADLHEDIWAELEGCAMSAWAYPVAGSKMVAAARLVQQVCAAGVASGE
jgi:hypothetical protein